MKKNHIMNFESYSGGAPGTAPAKPRTKPGTKPGTRPGRPAPTRNPNPGVKPRPKAELEDVIDLFDYLANDKDKQEINNYYGRKNG